MSTNLSITDAQNASVATSLLEKSALTSTLKPGQGELLLNIFRSHSASYSGMFLSLAEMNKVYYVLHSARSESISSKQRLREWCFADTVTMHRLICNPVELVTSQRALTVLPGAIEAYMDRLTEIQARSLLSNWIDPKFLWQLKNQNPGKIFLDAFRTRNILFYEFLCAAGLSSPALSEEFLARTEEAEGTENHTALMYAAEQGNLEIVNFLLQAANHYKVTETLLQSRNDDGQTAFMLAARNGHLEVVRALLRAVESESLVVQLALFEVPDNEGWTLFANAAYGGNVEIMQIILDAKEPEFRASLFTTRDDIGRLPLMLAGSAEAVTFLLGHGVQLGNPTRAWFLSAVDQVGRNSLCYAMIAVREATRRPEEVIRALLAAGTDLAVDLGQDTPLMLGAACGNAENVQALLGAVDQATRARLLAAINQDCESPLHCAMQAVREGTRRPEEVIRVLIAAGADPFAEDCNDKTPLMIGVDLGNAENVQALLEAVDPVTRARLLADRNDFGKMLFTRAACNRRNPETLRVLFNAVSEERRPDLILEQDDAGRTALMSSATLENTRLLLTLAGEVDRHNELINMRDQNGSTALFTVISRTVRELTQLSLTLAREVNQQNALINMRDQDGVEALVMETSRRIRELWQQIVDTENQNLEEIALLIEAGLSPRDMNFSGLTAFSHAIGLGNAKIVQLLLGSAELEVRDWLLKAKNHEGKNTLMHAVERDKGEIVNVLFDAVTHDSRKFFRR